MSQKLVKSGWCYQPDSVLPSLPIPQDQTTVYYDVLNRSGRYLFAYFRFAFGIEQFYQSRRWSDRIVRANCTHGVALDYASPERVLSKRKSNINFISFVSSYLDMCLLTFVSFAHGIQTEIRRHYQTTYSSIHLIGFNSDYLLAAILRTSSASEMRFHPPRTRETIDKPDS